MRRLLSNLFTLMLLGLAAGLAYSLYALPSQGGVDEQPPETAENPSPAGLVVGLAGPDDVEINRANRVVGPKIEPDPAPPSSNATGSARPPANIAAESPEQAQTGPPVADPIAAGVATSTTAAVPTSSPSTPQIDNQVDQAPTTVRSTPGETVEGSSLTTIELDIVALTNEIRTNPNGTFGRRGPFIDCGGRIAVDRAKREYIPVPALTVHEEASVRVARAWSEQLSTDLEHRDQAGAGALRSIGLEVVWAGENVSYNNYDDVVRQHVEGWRESDGHFCNLMSPRFTHLAVGEYTDASGMSYATQNFFSLS